MTVQGYHLPVDRSAYLPDPLAPVDRWLQAANASNVETTAAVIRDLAALPPVAVVDPFVGGGSTVAAARSLNLPAFGIELDPVLACAALAKARATKRHAGTLLHAPAARSAVELTKLMVDFESNHDAADALVLSCLAVLLAQATPSRTLTAADMLADLDVYQAPSAASTVIWGDATESRSWDGWPVPDGHVVVYTSPPFGASSPRLSADDFVERSARRVLEEGGVARATSGPGEFAAYSDAAMAVVRLTAQRFSDATIILEHEPADDGTDSRANVAGRLADEFAGAVSGIRVLESESFSWRGPLSFITCRIRR